MVKNLLFQVPEEQYIKLKTLMVRHKLKMEEFIGFLTNHIEDLDRMLIDKEEKERNSKELVFVE